MFIDRGTLAPRNRAALGLAMPSAIAGGEATLVTALLKPDDGMGFASG